MNCLNKLLISAITGTTIAEILDEDKISIKGAKKAKTGASISGACIFLELIDEKARMFALEEMRLLLKCEDFWELPAASFLTTLWVADFCK